jgi:hypothetical protein
MVRDTMGHANTHSSSAAHFGLGGIPPVRRLAVAGGFACAAGLYLTLKALDVDVSVKVANIAAMFKPHEREYMFFDGALLVDGVLMDLRGNVGEDQIATRLRLNVESNADLVWGGEVSWTDLQQGRYEQYSPRDNDALTCEQFQALVSRGVAFAQSFQLGQGIRTPMPARRCSTARL